MYFLIVSVWIFTCLTESKVFDSFVGLVSEPIEEDKKSRSSPSSVTFTTLFLPIISFR